MLYTMPLLVLLLWLSESSWCDDDDELHDKQDWLTMALYPLTGQDAFCLKATNKSDLRYSINAFAVMSSGDVNKRSEGQFELWIFAANALFVVDYDKPTFQVSRSRQFYDYSDQLPNDMFFTINTVSATFTTVAFKLGNNVDVLAISINRDSSYHYFSMYRNVSARVWSLDKTGKLDFPTWEVNAYLTNASTTVANKAHNWIDLTTDRVVAHAHYFFFLSHSALCYTKSDGSRCTFTQFHNLTPIVDHKTMEIRPEVQLWKYSPLDLNYIQRERYYIYKFVDDEENKTTWIWRQGEWDQPGSFVLDTNALYFMHNGYIHGNRLYMTHSMHIMTYLFEWQPKYNGFLIEWLNVSRTADFLSCKLTWADNYASKFILVMIAICIIGVIGLALVRATINSSRIAYRYLLDPVTGNTLQLTDHMLMKAKQA